mgnify:CR=1 FL=1
MERKEVLYFAEMHKGSWRPTGYVCYNNHVYIPPAGPDEAGWWVGEGCFHPSTDGIVFTPSEEEKIDRMFEWGVHDMCHTRPEPGCRYCNPA